MIAFVFIVCYASTFVTTGFSIGSCSTTEHFCNFDSIPISHEINEQTEDVISNHFPTIVSQKTQNFFTLCHFSDFHEAFERELDRLPKSFHFDDHLNIYHPSRLAALKYAITRLCPKHDKRKWDIPNSLAQGANHQDEYGSTDLLIDNHGRKEDSLIIFSGDMLHGSPQTYGQLGHQELSIMSGKALKYLGIDFMTLGNHDIDNNWITIDGLLNGFKFNKNQKDRNNPQLIVTNLNRTFYIEHFKELNQFKDEARNRLSQIYEMAIINLNDVPISLHTFPHRICLIGFLTTDTMNIARIPLNSFQLSGGNSQSYASSMDRAFRIYATLSSSNSLEHSTIKEVYLKNESNKNIFNGYNNINTEFNIATFQNSFNPLMNQTFINDEMNVCLSPDVLRIAITHLGIRSDENLVEYILNPQNNYSINSLPHLILGGHSHTILPSDLYPLQINDKNHNKTVLLSYVGAFGELLGRLQLSFNNSSFLSISNSSEFQLFNITLLLDTAINTFNELIDSFKNKTLQSQTLFDSFNQIINEKLSKCASMVKKQHLIELEKLFNCNAILLQPIPSSTNNSSTINIKSDSFQFKESVMCCNVLLLKSLLQYDREFLNSYRSIVEKTVLAEAPYLDGPIGVLDIDNIYSSSCRSGECGLGNFVADSIRWKMLTNAAVNTTAFNDLFPNSQVDLENHLTNLSSLTILNSRNFLRWIHEGRSNTTEAHQPLIAVIGTQPSGNLRGSVFGLTSIKDILKQQLNTSEFNTLLNKSIQKDETYRNHLYALTRHDITTILPYNNSINIFLLQFTDASSSIEKLTTALFRSLFFHAQHNSRSSFLLHVSGLRFGPISCHESLVPGVSDNQICASLEIAIPLRFPLMSIDRNLARSLFSRKSLLTKAVERLLQSIEPESISMEGEKISIVNLGFKHRKAMNIEMLGLCRRCTFHDLHDFDDTEIVDVWISYSCHITYNNQPLQVKSHCSQNSQIGILESDLLRMSTIVYPDFESIWSDSCTELDIDTIRYQPFNISLFPDVQCLISTCDWSANGGDSIFIEINHPSFVFSSTDYNKQSSYLSVNDVVVDYLNKRLKRLQHHSYMAEKCLLHHVNFPNIEGRIKLLDLKRSERNLDEL